MSWTIAQAKDQLSQIARRAIEEGPQTIGVAGRETAVLLSKTQFEQVLSRNAPASLKELLVGLNLDGVDLDRQFSPARDIEL